MAYSDKVQAIGPLAYWPIWELSGVSIDDITAQVGDGTASNVTLGVTGIGDGKTAGRFNGTTSSIDIYSALLNTAFDGAEGTISAWMKVSGAGVWTDGVARRVVNILINANNSILVRRSTANNTLNFRYEAGGTTETLNIFGQSSTDWMHLAFTWSATADEVEVFIDGVSQTTSSGLGIWAGALSATDTLIGAASTAGANVWSGDIAHVAIFDSPLSQPNITALATVATAEMDVFGAGNLISDGDATPSTTDNTDLGNVNLSLTKDVVYTIANAGDTALGLTSTPRVSIIGSARFTLNSDAPVSIAADGSGTFTIRYTPGAPGTDTATISIANDVLGKNPYTFAIQATAVRSVEFSTPTTPPKASYQVKILDPNNSGALLAFYDLYGTTIQSLRYIRRVNSIGTFQFTVPLTAENDRLFEQFDLLVEIERYPSLGASAQIEMTGLTRHVERFVDSDDQSYLIVGGYSLEELLSRRVVVPGDDPAAAGGYSTKDGDADDVMVELVTEQASTSASVARRIQGLVAQASASVGQPVGLRLRYENLLETIMSITTQGAMDFRIERTSAAVLTFIAAVIGSDLTKDTNYPGSPFVLFDPNIGNLSEPNLTFDRRDESTYVYLQGQGPDEDREVYENQSARIMDTPYNRIEIANDVREIEENDTTKFLTQAAALLDEKRPALDFSFTASRAAQDYRVMWNLGDLVTVQWNDYAEDLRIWAVEVEIETEETISPVLGLP